MSQSVLTIGERCFLLSDLPPRALDQWVQVEFCQRNIDRLARELTLLQQIRESALSVLPALLPASVSAGLAVPQPKHRRYWPSAPACKPRRP